MAKHDETVYKADLHTRAKHDILAQYLRRWTPILRNQVASSRRGQLRRLLYIDGFAGAGEYVGDVPGSPVVAIDAIRESGVDKAAVPVEIVLIEKQTDRVRRLTEIVDRTRSQLPAQTSVNIRNPIEGDCETEVRKLIELAKQENQPLGPCFAFLDQFGYGEFSIDLIGSLLSHDSCETLSFFNWRMMHPWLTDPTKESALRRGFGSDVWREMIDLNGQAKAKLARSLYEKALRERCGAKYVYPFTMRGADDQISYWLFFCTNNIRGLEEMKEAMWKVDESGGFSFSDKNGDSPPMFSYTDDDLASDLDRALRGKQVSVNELHEHVLTQTPAYQWMTCVRHMERKGMVKAIDPPPGRKAGGYRGYPNMLLEFRPPHPVQKLLFA